MDAKNATDATDAMDAPGEPGLSLLLLYGSRARADEHPGSDWDFGYLAGPEFVPDGLLARLSEALETDDIDLVDLARASGLLRYRAAAEGRVLYAATADAFPRFWMEAVSFWCDMAPVLEPGYRDALARVGS